jgi:hypothetical protein
MHNKHIQELREKIAGLLSRWPAHSVPPAMVQELDDLEDELARELKRANQADQHAEKNHPPDLSGL